MIHFDARVEVYAPGGQVYLFRAHRERARRLVGNGEARRMDGSRRKPCRKIEILEVEEDGRKHSAPGCRYTYAEPLSTGRLIQHKHIAEIDLPLFRLSVLENLVARS